MTLANPHPERIETGRCRLCQNAYSARGIPRHLASCWKRNGAAGPTGEGGVLLNIEAPGRWYWLSVCAPASTKLQQLDRFLKDIWMNDGCGHLSRFLQRSDAWRETAPKRATLAELLPPGTSIVYLYDMGDTTAVYVRSVAAVPAPENITILARNEPPRIPCNICQAPATEICAPCETTNQYTSTELCQDCAKVHRCDPYSLLPLVNSPRTGICGYDGPMPRARYRDLME